MSYQRLCPDCGKRVDASLSVNCDPDGVYRHGEVIGQCDRVTASREVRKTSRTGGEKGAKPARYDLIPAEPLRAVAELYGKGAEKYADHNWRRGYDWSLSFAAMQRHAWQFWNGEDNDAETGMPHMASVAFHALALIEFMATHRDYDDRPNKPQD